MLLIPELRIPHHAYNMIRLARRHYGPALRLGTRTSPQHRRLRGDQEKLVRALHRRGWIMARITWELSQFQLRHAGSAAFGSGPSVDRTGKRWT